MKKIFLSLFILVVVACGKDKELLSDLLHVDYYLTRGDCDKAKEVLDEMGPSLNARYIGARANVEACYAGFSELNDLFTGNLENIDPTNFQTVLKSFASFGTPEILDAEGNRYLKLREAIDIILFSDGEYEPSAQNRNLIFGTKHATDLNMQALYMLMYQFASYLKTYGNTNTFGDKGQGIFGNKCFLSYTDPNVIFAIENSSIAGGCDENNVGSPFLDFITIPDEAIRRSCEGIVIFNNIIDILKNISIPQSHAGELEDMLQTIENYLAMASTDPDVAPYLNIRSNISCESEFSVNQAGFEKAYFALFEVGLL